MDYKSLSEKLIAVLGLDSQPAGIKLLNDNKLPGYDNSHKLTFCQFVMKAREGKKLLVTSENIACANGGSALGLLPVPEKLLNGELMHKLGTFEAKGARKSMELLPRFRQNQFSGIAVAPLADVDYDPDIVSLQTKPEHLMWLSLATIYQEGGRLQFSSSVSNGTCVDTLVVPYLTQKLNVCLGCYGCRNATNIPDEHLLAGFPGNQLESIVDVLDKLSEKAMPRTRAKKAYARLVNK
ncbi:MAG: DUF169 domain-containing protein [Syntrophomonadales bacterium]